MTDQERYEILGYELDAISRNYDAASVAPDVDKEWVEAMLRRSNEIIGIRARMREEGVVEA